MEVIWIFPAHEQKKTHFVCYSGCGFLCTDIDFEPYFWYLQKYEEGAVWSKAEVRIGKT